MQSLYIDPNESTPNDYLTYTDDHEVTHSIKCKYNVYLNTQVLN